jgi:hypothetical protein
MSDSATSFLLGAVRRRPGAVGAVADVHWSTRQALRTSRTLR